MNSYFVRLVAVGLAALFVLAVVFAGYSHVRDLRQRNEDLAAAAITQQIRASIAETHEADLRARQEATAARLQSLEKARAASEAELVALRDQIDALNLEEDFRHDIESAIRALNDRTRELNRLLEREAAGADRGRR